MAIKKGKRVGRAKDMLAGFMDRLFSSKASASARLESLQGELYASLGVGSDPMSWLGSMPDPDPVLRKSGDGVWVLRELLADDKVIGCIQSRKLGTLKKRNFAFEPWSGDGGKTDKRSEALTMALKKDLERVDLYNVFSQVLDAPYFGFTPVEVLWRAEGGWMHIEDLKPRPHEWFGFNAAHRPVFLGDEAGEVPFGKLVVARHFPDASNPYGLRLLSRCLWPVAIKKGGIRFWATLCEKFGMPWVIGKARQGADEKERSEMLSRLSAMVRDAVAVVTGGSEVEIHLADGKASGDLHSALVDRMDKAIAFVLMGQTLTADIGSAGSLAAAQTHLSVLDDYREADEALICTFMEEVAWIYGQVNDASAITPAFKFDEPEDLKELAELDSKLHSVGVRFLPVHFERRYSLESDEFTMASDTPPAPPQRGNIEEDRVGNIEGDQEGDPEEKGREDGNRSGREGTAMAAPPGAPGGYTPEQQAIEDLAARCLDEALAVSRDLRNKVDEAIARAETPEDLLLLLAEIFEEAGRKDELGDVLLRGILAANLWGRTTVLAEGEN